MKNWMKFLETLAEKLTAILAFAVALIAVLALVGERIPDTYIPLVYIAAIGAMIIFVIQIKKPAGEKAEAKPDTGKGKETLPSTDARTDYLRAVMADCRTMRLVGLDPHAADPSRGGLTLEALYVSLDTTTTVDEEGDVKKRGWQISKKESDELSAFPGREKSRPLSALEALALSENQRAVLLGLPGTGKSTFARYLALRMAQAETDRSQSLEKILPGWDGGMILPIIISLGRMAETIPADCEKGSAELVENHIVETLQNDERMAAFSGQVLRELERSGGLVLFDGLDEVADLNLRPVVVQAVEDFVQKYERQKSSRFLVTCRTYSYHHDAKWQLSGWPTHELALLDDERIKYFVDAWHDEHIRIEPARKSDFERKRERLQISLQPDDRRRLHEIAPFPIILTMMAVVHTHYGELPDTRAEVYERCVDLLLVRWEAERLIAGQTQETQKRTILDELDVSRMVLNRALWEVAYKAHEGREDGNDKKRGPALVTEDLLTGVLNAHFGDLDKVKIFLDYCQSSNGLLMLQGAITPADAPPGTPPRRVYAFPHLTFEEYLAARYLIRPNFGKTVRALAQKSDRWREIILFLGEALCFLQGDQERMEILLTSLAPKTSLTRAGDNECRTAWYAGDLLSLYRRAFPSEQAGSDEKIRKGLHQLVVKGALAPRERAAAADTLDELDYTPKNLYDFIPIRSSDLSRSETAEAVTTGNFFIAKYPVTNGQYDRFLEQANFENQTYWRDFPKYDEKGKLMKGETWGEEGWKWLDGALKDEDNVENGELLPRYWRDPRFGLTRKNAPVVGISWYEANAYCRWLAEQTDSPELKNLQTLNLQPETLTFRLPTEKEWVLAAGGDKDNRHTWGVLKDEKQIPCYANTSESGISRTTPVWMYPAGKSEYDVSDMSGNVWEWMANYRDNDHDVLALRGGSWFITQGSARVAGRNYGDPRSGGNLIGVRLAAFPNK